MNEDMLNVMGSFISTELDAFENLHKELEEKDKEIERLNNIIKEVREYINDNVFHSKNQEEQELYDIALLEILDKAGDSNERNKDNK